MNADRDEGSGNSQDGRATEASRRWQDELERTAAFIDPLLRAVESGDRAPITEHVAELGVAINELRAENDELRLVLAGMPPSAPLAPNARKRVAQATQRPRLMADIAAWHSHESDWSIAKTQEAFAELLSYRYPQWEYGYLLKLIQDRKR